jgi:hypothetical protein
MSNQVDVKKNELHFPNLVPSKQKTQEYGEKSSQLQQAVNEVRKTFQPDANKCKLYILLVNNFYRIGCTKQVQFKATSNEHLPKPSTTPNLPKLYRRELETLKSYYYQRKCGLLEARQVEKVESTRCQVVD